MYKNDNLYLSHYIYELYYFPRFNIYSVDYSFSLESEC